MAKYYCVLFDADNTLLNFDAAESKALAETLVNYGIEPDAETVQTYRTINSELWRQLEKGQIKREKLMAERFTRFLKAIYAAGDGAEMNRFYLEQLSTHPDLMGPEVLDVLRAHRLEPKRLAFVKNRPDAAPWLFLVEAQKNRKTGLRVEPDVLISAGAAMYGR